MKNFIAFSPVPAVPAFFSIKKGGNRCIALLFLWASLVAGCFSMSFSQGASWGENTDLWRVRGMAGYDLPGNQAQWHGDSLWVGATFMRDTTKNFIVWRAHYYEPQGGYRGALYLMVPRPGKPDSALFLFYNRCNEAETPPVPDSLDLTNNVFVRGAIHHMDTLFFMYRSWLQNNGGGACPPNSPFQALTTDKGVRQDDSLFTGPNRVLTDVPAWLNLDRHYSLRNSATLVNPGTPVTFFSLNQQKTVPVGRRWCEAGWVHTVRGGNIRTDTVEFGFEDQFNGGDINYEDIRFNVTGVFLMRPVLIDTLLLNFFPPRDTIRAGDSIVYRAVLQGRDSLGREFLDSTNLAATVTWNLRETAQSKSALRLGNGPSNTNTFKAVTAYEWDTVTASCVNPRTGMTLQTSRRVYVMPGPVARLVIQADSGIRLNDPTFTSRAGQITLGSASQNDSAYAVLRDYFGNWIGYATLASWSSQNATIATVVAGKRSSTLGEGVIHRISFNDTTTWGYAIQGQLKDSILIILNKTNIITMDSAITRDLNGNGYIDRIDIFFSKDSAVNMGPGNFFITCNGVPFPVDSVVKLSVGSYAFFLREQHTPAPQSAWMPQVTVKDLPGVENGTVTAADGCPPVIWRVIKYSVSEDRTQDTVKVFMSEKVKATKGSAFTIVKQPSQAFYVWDSSGTVRLDTMLNGINSFYNIVNDSILIFVMINGHNLTNANWMNIQADNLPLCDKNGNFPTIQNQKVRVEIFNNQIVKIQVGPNPAGPTTKRVPDGMIYFDYQHNSAALSWIKADRAGTVITFGNLPVPGQASQKAAVTAYLKIYDVVGNLVNWSTARNIFENDPVTGGIVPQKNIYWNGLNKEGMKVAPGVYRTVVYIDYHGAGGIRNVKMITKIGIAR